MYQCHSSSNLCQLWSLSGTPQNSSCIISSGCSSAGGGCIKLVGVTRTVFVIFCSAGWREDSDPCSQTGFPCPWKMTLRSTLGHTEALNRRTQAASLGKRWTPPGVKRQSQYCSKSSRPHQSPHLMWLVERQRHGTSRKSMLEATC